MDFKWCLGILIFCSLSSAGAKVKFEDCNTELTFNGSAKALSARIPFSGTSKALSGYYEVKDSVALSMPPKDVFTGIAGLPLQTLDTGISGRNKHMLEDLGVAGNPVAALRYEGIGESFHGDLTLNGVTKPIEGTVSRSPLKFNFALRLSDFNIPRRSQLGMKVQDDVQITVLIQPK